MGDRSLILWESANAEPIAARIAIGGDFLPAGNLTLSVNDWKEAARGLEGYFVDIGTSFVNLECVLDAEHLQARKLFGLGQTVRAPLSALDYLCAIRSQAAGVANNHILDFESAGVKRTLAALSNRGIVPLGTARDLRHAPEIFIWQGPNDIRVGFWAAASACHDLACTLNYSGVEPATVARASQALDALKARGANFAVALIHAGCLRTNRPDPAESRLLDAIAGCGFGIVAASHSRTGSAALESMASSPPARPSICFYTDLAALCRAMQPDPMELRRADRRRRLCSSCGRLVRVEVRPVILGQTGLGEIPSPEVGNMILKRFCDLSAEIEGGSSG